MCNAGVHRTLNANWLTLMEIPFEHIGMDHIGPFHRSARGYRFVLMMVDYATQYLEAVPLCTISVSGHLPSWGPKRGTFTGN